MPLTLHRTFTLALRVFAAAAVLSGALGAQGTLAAQAGPVIPAPRGMVNDFANVIPPAQAARIEALAADVRAKSGGEIAVVTMSDIGGRDEGDVALRIGREWKVGANAKIGDSTRNAGVVILVVPKETSSDGKGHVSIQTGQGSEGFITDAQAGDIRREAMPLLQQRQYGDAIELMTTRVAQRFASSFNFSLDSAAPPELAPRQYSRRGNSTGGFPPQLVFFIFILLVMILSRGRGSGCLWLALSSGGGRGGWGGGGFGGGGGGGFGGFGGGGGFSGGGSSGSW